MLNKNEILDFLKKNKNTFYLKYNITKIGLFGSFARGEETEKSDIDIIIRMKPQTKEIFEKKCEIKKLIKNKYNRNVDICSEKYIKPIFKEYIFKETIYV
ncbi:MAG: nucleotidyltransferase domain-containing protein [Bacteroidales bacterium]|nr:nucleotidyltransferase domain-containing protein [Bacteroidales bacterium]